MLSHKYVSGPFSQVDVQFHQLAFLRPRAAMPLILKQGRNADKSPFIERKALKNVLVYELWRWLRNPIPKNFWGQLRTMTDSVPFGDPERRNCGTPDRLWSSWTRPVLVMVPFWDLSQRPIGMETEHRNIGPVRLVAIDRQLSPE